MQSILILLQMAVSLLAAIQQHPNLPDSFRTEAIRISHIAIATAQQALIQASSSIPSSVTTPTPREFSAPIPTAPILPPPSVSLKATSRTHADRNQSFEASGNPVPLDMNVRNDYEEQSILRIVATIENSSRCVKQGDWQGEVPLTGQEGFFLIDYSVHRVGDILSFSVLCSNSEGATASDTVQALIVPHIIHSRTCIRSNNDCKDAISY